MPLIAIHTGKELAPETRSEIVDELGKIVTVIPGKNAGNLMTHFDDGAEMAFAGAKTDSCVYVDVKLHGASEHAAKTALVENCCAMLVSATGIPAENIYITVAEFPNWGALGKYL